MSNHAPRSRTRRRAVAAAIAVAIAASVAGAVADGPTPVAIIHPMQPIGNIDCCH